MNVRVDDASYRFWMAMGGLCCILGVILTFVNTDYCLLIMAGLAIICGGIIIAKDINEGKEKVKT